MMSKLGKCVQVPLATKWERELHNGSMKSSRINIEFYSTVEILMELYQLMDLKCGSINLDGTSKNKEDNTMLMDKWLGTLNNGMDLILELFMDVDTWLHNGRDHKPII